MTVTLSLTLSAVTLTQLRVTVTHDLVRCVVVGLNVIEVARDDGSQRMTLIDSDLDRPRAIAVYPQRG